MSIVAVEPQAPSIARRIPGMAQAYWSSPSAFVYAAAGASIGLGNVWRFPYLVERYGGGAFVLVHLLSLLLLALPILMTEVMVGRRGRSDPAESLARLARTESRAAHWSLVGWLGSFAGVLILSVHSLVAGWSIAALGNTAADGLAGSGDAAAREWLFAGLLADPWTMAGCQTLFLACAVLITGRGVREGLERTQAWLLPALLLVLVGLVVYAGVATGRLGEGLAQLLHPDFAKLGWRGALEALRHALLTLGLGLGVMMSFGAALPDRASITRSGSLVVLLDTGVALLAALVVTTLVLPRGTSLAEGPTLAFMTIPAAAGLLPGGSSATVAFYAFLALASLSAALGILHPIVEHLVCRFRLERQHAALLAAGGAWTLGLIAIITTMALPASDPGRWAVFDWLGYVGSSLLLPAAALGVVVFGGWAMSRRASRGALGSRTLTFLAWRWLVRYAAPVGLAAVLMLGVLERIWR